MNCLQIPTPAFLFDKKQTQKNAEMMLNYASKYNIRLRPHVKTHKTEEIASLQCDSSKAITVSTISELEYFYKCGFKNQTYAVPITAEKLLIVLEKISVNEINFITDNVAHLEKLIEVAQSKQTIINLFIKIDVGAQRAGIQPDSEQIFGLAIAMQASDFINFKGILTHAGQSYHTSEKESKLKIAHHEVQIISEIANKLEALGIPVLERSIGSTPTMVQGVKLDGITEIRPGNYIWFDVFQHNRGNCKLSEIACSVLTSVIGVYPERETILIDAGALALSKDSGFWPNNETKYGIVKGFPNLNIVGLSQEHGKISASAKDCADIKVGDKLEVLPNHSCLSAACFEKYYEIDGGIYLREIKPAKNWY